MVSTYYCSKGEIYADIDCHNVYWPSVSVVRTACSM